MYELDYTVHLHKNNTIMKRTLLFSVLLLCALGAEATIRRVNNITGVNAQYTTFSAAVTASSAGDTIYLEPSPIVYGGVTLNKKLTIIGNGYFNNPSNGYVDTRNAGLQANMANSSMNFISFSIGSAFSTIMGCTVGDITIQESNITVKRNFISNGLYISNLHPSLGVYQNFTNADIRQNVIGGYGIYYSQFDGTAGSFSSINIQNNIIRNTYGFSYGIWQLNGASGFIQNNVLDVNVGINVYSFQINSNIMIGGAFTANNNVWFNNIATNTAFGTANSNQQNITTTNLFTNYTATTETRYSLKTPGPGIGTGFGGIDVGIFSGPDPYRFSGIPPIPTIYLFTAPATTTATTLPVTISTRSNN